MVIVARIGVKDAVMDADQNAYGGRVNWCRCRTRVVLIE
jgi:hypothetical protein